MIKKTEERVSIPMVVDIPYEFSAGHYLARTLTELRDNGKFYAVKCPRCGRVQLPPRIVCAECHVKNEEWVELGQEGTLLAFTIMYLPLTDPTTGKPHNPPFVYGSVQLDGATSVLDHLIQVEPDMDKVWVGMRCRIVLRPKNERMGDLSDIKYFEPLPGQKNPGKAKEEGAEKREERLSYPPFKVKQHLKAHSTYHAGKMGSIFYTNLRDSQVLVGARCPTCDKVYWPPRSTCGKCFSELTEVVELGPLGTVETFALVTYSEPIHPRKAPFLYGIIKLDGAETGITHFIDEVDYEKVHIGMRVRPVFAGNRKGNILDIRYFKPA